VNAFVEIVFDNSDHRFALENSDEVVLRRTVGLKKDEFFLQRKRATKNEIQSLLEGAGFSKSNPYFIVQQGKVQDLCTMADPERLRLLKEVAGTVVYDEKKTESLAKMEENTVSIDKIQEILSEVKERLETLQSEKEELTVYQQLDRQRRALEYTLYDKELRKARAALDALEQERSTHVLELATLHEAAKTTHVSIRNIEADLTAKTNQLRRNRLQLQQLEGDKTASVTTCAKLELECRELRDAVVNGEEVLKTNQQALLGIEQEITAAEERLSESVQPAYEEAVAALQQMTDQRNQAKRTQESLYAKQGRGRQFSTVAERDTSIQSNVTELQTAVAEKQSAMTEQQDVLSNLRRTVAQESKDISSLSAQVTQQAAGLQSLSKTIDEKKRQRLELVDARKEDWRKTEELHEQVRDARQNYHQALSDTRKVMPRATAMGLEALRTIVEQERLVVGEQYFGMLMDNMDLKDARYQTAVEVAAQNSLFHVIVDNDNTAARLMNRLEKDKLGRVTFLPLNKLRVENVQYPDNNDVKPLLDLCITYDKKVKAAMQHVFNKKLLARTPELASEWSTKLSMDVITLDGDLCSRKGALTGGFVDVNKSRLRAHATQKESKETLASVEREHQEVNRKAKEVDQSASNVMQELQRLEAKHAELTHMITGKETEVERMQSRIENHKKQVEKVEKSTIPLLEREIAVLEGDIGRLQEEMGTELTASLSDEDRELLKELKQTQADLVAEIESQSEKVAQMGVERQKLTSLLDDNLRRRRLELMEGIAGNEEGESRRLSRGRMSSAAAQSQLKEDLEERQRQLDNATQTKDDIEARVEESRAIEEELRGELISAKNELEQLRSQDMKDMKVLEEAQDKSERLLTKVRRRGCRFSNDIQCIPHFSLFPFFLPLLTEIHVRFETRDLHAEDPRTWIASTAFGT
jgi:structural maintenance of chromosome 3 (chondroitin sulfate proteoglycan 6)